LGLVWVLAVSVNEDSEKAAELEKEIGFLDFWEDEIGLLRFKLKYLPMIMRTAMCPMDVEVNSLEDAIMVLKGWKVPRPFGFYGLYDLFEFPKPNNLHEILSRWVKEDAENLDKLISMLPVKLKLITHIVEEVEKHLAWPASVLELEEVRNEIDFLLSKPFLTMDNDYDKWIVKSVFLKTAEKSKEINTTVKRVGKSFDRIAQVYRKHKGQGAIFWFTFFMIPT